MKKTLILLIMISYSLSVKADCYTNYEIKITIETIGGKIQTGYVNISSCLFDVDLLGNTEYIKTTLIQYGWFDSQSQSKDDFCYFQDRMKYVYKIWDNHEQKDTLYYLLNEKYIPIKNIKTIRIDNIIGASAFKYISNYLQLKDTIWMRKQPIKEIGIGGYLCGHRIFVYANSQKITNTIREIELKQKEIELIDIDIKNGDEIDEDIWKIVKKFNSEKVVVVSECSD